MLKPGQNKKGQKFFQLHCFLNLFLELAAEDKDSKNDAARNFFGPSYIVTALVQIRMTAYGYSEFCFYFLKNENNIKIFIWQNLFLKMSRNKKIELKEAVCILLIHTVRFF